MALFKFRKAGGGGDEPAAAGAPRAESVEVLRRRARHRLIGAVVLVLAGVAGFPLLFDTQPRPIPVDIPIEIPDRNKAKPLPMPAPPAARPAASGAIAPPPASAPAVAAAPAPVATPAPAAPVAAPAAASQAQASTAGKPAAAASVPKPAQAQAQPPKTETKPEPKAAEAKPEPRPEPKTAEAKPAARMDDGAKAQALLEGRPLPAAADAGEGRFIVQVGAFSDVAKARETRLKVERAGLKTYTHVAETKEGKRIRVRVGPFPTRAEADRAAQKIKGLDLPAAILTL